MSAKPKPDFFAAPRLGRFLVSVRERRVMPRRVRSVYGTRKRLAGHRNIWVRHRRV